MKRVQVRRDAPLPPLRVSIGGRYVTGTAEQIKQIAAALRSAGLAVPLRPTHGELKVEARPISRVRSTGLFVEPEEPLHPKARARVLVRLEQAKPVDRVLRNAKKVRETDHERARRVTRILR